MGLEIRHATEDDINVIVFLVAMMAGESPRYSKHGFSPEKADALARFLVKQRSLFVAESLGEIIGFFAGLVTEQYLSHDKYATDIGVFVLPDHRGGSAFIRLVRAFENWAVEQGATELLMGVSTGIHPEKTVRMYERLGYTISTYGLIKAGV